MTDGASRRTFRSVKSTPRRLALILLFIIVAFGGWLYLSQRPMPTPTPTQALAIYYTRMDGQTQGTWSISMRPPVPGESAGEHQRNTILYAAVQSIAGPPNDVQAIRFPNGTRVQGVSVKGKIAVVDLAGAITKGSGGSFSEDGEFKSLVYTLTAIHGIDAVQIMIDGHIVDALPGGHLALNQPLHRSDW